MVSRVLKQVSLSVIILQKIGAILKEDDFADRIESLDTESKPIILSLLAGEKLGRSQYLLQFIQSPLQLVKVLCSLPTLTTLGLKKLLVEQSILIKEKLVFLHNYFENYKILKELI